MEKATLEAKQAAQYLGCSYWTILEMAKKGQVPHIRVGKRVLFRKNVLDQWMEEQEKLSIAKTEETGYGKLRRVAE
jgi:excisionase family DNA binding protein